MGHRTNKAKRSDIEDIRFSQERVNEIRFRDIENIFRVKLDTTNGIIAIGYEFLDGLWLNGTL
ncbi:uncharacterized protein N7459_006544 [Penicillium hispanicum]|uniref:uncharacterized protein n=1 Tax=Penicillium hispanicum TaxID=1080232 RepID=UPI00254004D0|nr:uncharacterized protein N7459_006544 [Penicillium hispanicum]KAJ5577580.1 hypothetical protein N7459_006544 [Penicillium hispanicum]